MNYDKIGKTLILCPHVDDELYGCLGFIINNEVDIYYLTSSVKNHNKFEIIKDLYMNITNAHLYYKDLFPELSGGDHHIISEFDEYAENYDTILVPSKSYHQDHIFVNEAMIKALRPRPKLRCTICLEYNYVFNSSDLSRSGCITIYYDQDTYTKISDITTKFSEATGFGKETGHITSFKEMFKLNEFLGSFRNKPYAERYKPLLWDEV